MLRLKDAELHFGHKIILDQVSLQFERGERVCLLGRNGEGKTSLLNVLQHQVPLDAGTLQHDDGLVIRALMQAVPQDITGSVFDVVLQGLGEMGALLAEYEQVSHQLVDHPELMSKLETLQHQIETKQGWQLQQRAQTTLSTLHLDGMAQFDALSGGWKRRVLLAQALVAEPDVLLLDEPTNHLDVKAIEWLETFLPSYPGCLVFITHDRAFMQTVATRIIELDRGHLFAFEGRYQDFLRHKAERLATEEKHNALFDKRLAQEETWIRQGIKARRTRNEGRVRALQKMREERRQRVGQQGKATLTLNTAERSGKVVVEALDIACQRGDKTLFADVDVTIVRGDRIGVIGPNGCGKTTLLDCLLGRLTPSAGSIKLGTKLEIAYFDQLKNTLVDDQTAQDNVGEGSEYIELNGNKKHILGYLQDFLFTPERARQPIGKLSGGERSRLLLAKLFSKPSNVLVLDEPTNDLDVETLELLEALLADYSGTVLLVSHDRAFLDNVVTSTLVFEQRQVNEYVGGYQDWLWQRVIDKPQATSKPKVDKPKKTSNKLSYKDQRLLESLPARIETLEQEMDALQQTMATTDFYQRPAEEIKAQQTALAQKEQELEQAFADWESLETNANL